MHSQRSTRQGSHEQNLTNDSAEPNRAGDKYTPEGRSTAHTTRMGRLFSNLH